MLPSSLPLLLVLVAAAGAQYFFPSLNPPPNQATGPTDPQGNPISPEAYALFVQAYRLMNSWLPYGEVFPQVQAIRNSVTNATVKQELDKLLPAAYVVDPNSGILGNHNNQTAGNRGPANPCPSNPGPNSGPGPNPTPSTGPSSQAPVAPGPNPGHRGPVTPPSNVPAEAAAPEAGPRNGAAGPSSPMPGSVAGPVDFMTNMTATSWSTVGQAVTNPPLGGPAQNASAADYEYSG